MNKAWLIAREEFINNVKKPSFLFTAFGIPVVIVVIMFVIVALLVETEENTERIGAVAYVDQSGVLADPVEVPENFSAYPSEEAAHEALEQNTVGAYFVVPEDYIESGQVHAVSRTNLPEVMQDVFDAFLIANLGRTLDPETVERLIEPVNSQILTLDTGRVISSSAFFVVLFMPFIFVFVFMMGSQTTSTYLMSSVVEEKSNRLMEILITSVTPFQLLLGKIIGLGVLGLLQLSVWLIAGVLLLTFGQSLEFLQGVSVPTDMIITGLIFFTLNYFLYSSLMAGIGAVTGTETESRQYASILSLVTAVPFFLTISFFTDPDGPVVTFLTLFPFTSPISVIMKMAWGSMSIEHIILSAVILLVTTIVLIWVSARIFRWALLLYGKRPSLRQIFTALRRAPTMATTAPTSAADNNGGR